MKNSNYTIMVSTKFNPDEYVRVVSPPSLEAGAGYVTAGNADALNRGLATHYILVEGDYQAIPASDVWGGKVEVLFGME